MNRILTSSHALKALAGAALVAAAIAATSACVASMGGGVYVAVAPPVPIVEVGAVAPGPGLVWLPGFYRWDGGAYNWRPGHWERPPRPRAVWVEGRWERRGNRGWHYREGHWR